MKGLRYICIITILLTGSVYGYAQQNASFIAAYNCVKKGNIDSAKIYIDKALKDTATHRDPQFWYVRGFIYKEVYKKYESNSRQSAARDTSIADLIESTKIDSSADNKKSNYPTIKFLSGTYFNDAGALMDSLHYVLAKKYYRRFLYTMALSDPTTNLSSYQVQFNLKLGEVYSYLFFHAATDKLKSRYLDSAKQAYNEVLAINPNDVSANYNLAILFYNQAVYIINQTNYDDDISKLNAAQDTSVHLAMQSLPFMQKTYQLDPQKKDAIKGLEGIYYLLHDTQKFQEYEEKLKALDGGK
jgi:hypothetical protein